MFIVFARVFYKTVREKLHSQEQALCFVVDIFPLAYRSGMVSIKNEHVHTYYKHAYANGQTRCNVP